MVCESATQKLAQCGMNNEWNFAQIMLRYKQEIYANVFSKFSQHKFHTKTNKQRWLDSTEFCVSGLFDFDSWNTY